MTNDPSRFDSFLDKLKLDPVVEPVPPASKALLRGVVMQMDRWHVAGHVVIIPDAGSEVVAQVLNSRPAASDTADDAR
ncbi:hypothetical protein OU995_21345 [Roseateles sp. SL47]|uniref:hypothetical protein n=1 Tax=Roseateles sp. SL47 TaxID=2995138 RepID=UPI00226DE16B|nr:hypothetical protein [Roseateles sp. SL47]WAC72089.1 hypothetical protein OU995_21345 [Roseateles sp. SL47]